MRRITLVVVFAVVAAACSSGGGGGPVPSVTGDSFCDEARAISDEIDQMDTDGMEFGEIFGVMNEAYVRLGRKAPAELKSDIELIANATRRLDEWYREGATGESPLTDDEQQGYEAANARIDAYMTNECGIGDSGDDVGASGGAAEDGTAAASVGDEQYAATITVVVDGQTYTDNLGGPEEVICYTIGDEAGEGYLVVELQGPALYVFVDVAEPGVDPGSEGEADLFLDAADLDVADQVSVLQDIIGTIFIDEARPVGGDEWFFSGRVTGTSPEGATPATVDATFACVGSVNT